MGISSTRPGSRHSALFLRGSCPEWHDETGGFHDSYGHRAQISLCLFHRYELSLILARHADEPVLNPTVRSDIADPRMHKSQTHLAGKLAVSLLRGPFSRPLEVQLPGRSLQRSGHAIYMPRFLVDGGCGRSPTWFRLWPAASVTAFQKRPACLRRRAALSAARWPRPSNARLLVAISLKSRNPKKRSLVFGDSNTVPAFRQAGR